MKIALRIILAIVILFVSISIVLYLFVLQIRNTDIEIKKNNAIAKSVRSGDIIFQESKSAQSKAIQLATGSKYSHMGIVYENEGNLFVYEAVEPVKLTPFIDWVNRGVDRHYVVKRLINADELLTGKVLAKMQQVAEKFRGKFYDSHFEWSDDRMYCSELVWKIYHESTGIELGELKKLSSFNLETEIVKEIIQKRYGKKVPMDELVISPADIFNSDKLQTIID